jgi:hypothetical protein
VGDAPEAPVPGDGSATPVPGDESDTPVPGDEPAGTGTADGATEEEGTAAPGETDAPQIIEADPDAGDVTLERVEPSPDETGSDG